MYGDWNFTNQERHSDNAPSYVLLDINVRANIYKGIIGYGTRVQGTLGFEF